MAVFGESTGTVGGADGVHGVAHGHASGVTGVATAVNGVGVSGESPGWSFFANGDAHQAHDNGGWVKAMIHVRAAVAPYSIDRCFNSALQGPAARTPPCGINFREVQRGQWRFNFGFAVADRFISATLKHCPDCGLADRIFAVPIQNELDVYTVGGDNGLAYFDLIVY